mmetsp:Transcript_7916/g.15310  ORF Transcript_7916/g.15310 Transcript_7916/m.15310 type:complete len:379 (-) Transcript_7916:2867-4003(-)
MGAIVGQCHMVPDSERGCALELPFLRRILRTHTASNALATILVGSPNLEGAGEVGAVADQAHVARRVRALVQQRHSDLLTPVVVVEGRGQLKVRGAIKIEPTAREAGGRRRTAIVAQPRRSGVGDGLLEVTQQRQIQDRRVCGSWPLGHAAGAWQREVGHAATPRMHGDGRGILILDRARGGSTHGQHRGSGGGHGVACRRGGLEEAQPVGPLVLRRRAARIGGQARANRQVQACDAVTQRQAGGRGQRALVHDSRGGRVLCGRDDQGLLPGHRVLQTGAEHRGHTVAHGGQGRQEAQAGHANADRGLAHAAIGRDPALVTHELREEGQKRCVDGAAALQKHRQHLQSGRRRLRRETTAGRVVVRIHVLSEQSGTDGR